MALYRDYPSSAEIDYSKEFSPINILSIDVDWIMSPCIEAYNNYVNATDAESQTKLKMRMPGLQFYPDLFQFDSLLQLLLSDKCKLYNPDDFIVGQDHSEILSAIQYWDIKQPYNIWNIDHHHDCGYGHYTSTEELLSETGCANWIPKLYTTDSYFKEYIWIKNHNSDLKIVEPAQKILPKMSIYSSISEIPDIKFDKVFMAESPAWIPDNCKPLVHSLTMTFAYFIKK